MTTKCSELCDVDFARSSNKFLGALGAKRKLRSTRCIFLTAQHCRTIYPWFSPAIQRRTNYFLLPYVKTVREKWDSKLLGGKVTTAWVKSLHLQKRDGLGGPKVGWANWSCFFRELICFEGWKAEARTQSGASVPIVRCAKIKTILPTEFCKCSQSTS